MGYYIPSVPVIICHAVLCTCINIAFHYFHTCLELLSYVESFETLYFEHFISSFCDLTDSLSEEGFHALYYKQIFSFFFNDINELVDLDQ